VTATATLGQLTGPDQHQRRTAAFGDGHWVTTMGEWTLMGLNCFVFGTGLPAEAEQWAWAERTLSQTHGPIGLFFHKQLFIDRPDEQPQPLYTVSLAARQRLLDLIARWPVRFVASGHLHQHRRVTIDEVEYVWAPSWAFPGDTVFPGADAGLGWLRWQLDGREFSVERVQDGRLEQRDLKELRAGHSFLYQTPPCPPHPADLVDR
jgi:hypothetical protein